MYCNPRKFLPSILLISFVSTFATFAHAQQKTGNSPAIAPVVILDSTKDQDGLVGPVRRVQTEMVKLEIRAGVVVEGPRQLLEVTTYNLKGERVDNSSFLVAGSSGSEEYKYDDKGNISEMTLRGADGSVISREVYKYETDGVGNWTKMTTSLVFFEDGKLKTEPVETTYRTIAYFYDERIAKLLATPAAPSTAVPAEPASVESESTEPKNIASTAAPAASARERISTPALKSETKKPSGSAEGSKVESRVDSSNSGPKMEPSGALPSTENNLTSPNSRTSSPRSTETEVPPAKENTSSLSPYKAAFNFYKSGREQFSSGNLIGAIASYQQAIEIKPDFADVHLSLGHAFLRLKKTPEAIKAFKDAVRLNPEMDEAHYGLGLEYFRAGKVKDAADAFKKAVRVRPNLAKAHYGLALCYQEMGKQDQLLEEFRILQTLDAQLAKKLSDTFPEFNLPCAGRRCD